MDKIIILDEELTQKALITNWVSFSFTRQLSAVGGFELVINANDRQAGYIDNGDILYFGDEMCGYINCMEVVSESDMAQEKLTITGTELKDIISHRVVVPESGEENISYINESTGAIVTDLIDKCLVNPSDVDRKIDRLNVAACNLGSSIDYSARYKQLDTEIYNLLNIDGLGLRALVGLGSKIITLMVWDGCDRTYGQNINTRAIFSMRLNTLKTGTTTLDSAGYRTIGYVGGEGEGAEREIITEYNDNAAVGLDRKETFVDISDAKTTAELSSRGKAKMLEISKAYSIIGDTYYNNKMEYDLGDLVTVEDRFGNMDDVQITAIEISYTGSEPPVRKVTFGKAADTLSEAINKRLSGMTHILTN